MLTRATTRPVDSGRPHITLQINTFVFIKTNISLFILPFEKLQLISYSISLQPSSSMKGLSFKQSFILFLVLYLSLNISYKHFYSNGTFIDDGLRKSETKIAVDILQHFFENPESKSTIKKKNKPIEEIYINKKHTLGVINECDAFQIHLIYSIFILVITGIYPKWISLLFGNMIIYLSNILRLVSLTLIVHYDHDSFQFHHQYTFSLLLYLIVFMMWYFYLNEKKESIV